MFTLYVHSELANRGLEQPLPLASMAGLERSHPASLSFHYPCISDEGTEPRDITSCFFQALRVLVLSSFISKINAWNNFQSYFLAFPNSARENQLRELEFIQFLKRQNHTHCQSRIISKTDTKYSIEHSKLRNTNKWRPVKNMLGHKKKKKKDILGHKQLGRNKVCGIVTVSKMNRRHGFKRKCYLLLHTVLQTKCVSIKLMLKPNS